MLGLFFDAVTVTVGIVCGVYLALTVLVGVLCAVYILLEIIKSYIGKLYGRTKR